MNLYLKFKNYLGKSLEREIIFYFMIISIIGVGSLSVVFYQVMSKKIRYDLRERLLSSVAVASDVVDVGVHQNLSKAEDEKSEAYLNMRNKLVNIRKQLSDIKFIYTMRQNPAGEIIFVVDGSPDEDMSHLGDVYPEASDLLKGIIGNLSKPMAEEEFYTDKWGTFLSAYAPLIGSDGHLDGIIGIDISFKDVLATERKFLLLIFVFFLLVMTATYFLGRFIGRRLASPIIDLANEALKIEQGDYSFRNQSKRKDEVGILSSAFERMCTGILGTQESLNHQMMSLKNILENIAETAKVITQETEDINNVSSTLSKGSLEQTESLSQITGSVSIINDKIQANAKNANQASQLAQMGKTAADEGKKEIDENVLAMEQIKDSAEKISKIIKVIDEIAFQTNILALNAAVEAARAGKHGKGFAVVANEVRNLASRSAKAAQETEQLISLSSQKIAEGVSVAQRAAKGFDRLLDHNGQLFALIEKIAHLGEEQAQGMEDITKELSVIDVVTQRNAANASAITVDVQKLSGESAKLESILSSSSSSSAT